MTVELTAGETTVGYDPESARLTVTTGDGTLAAGHLRVAIGDGTAPSGPATVTREGDRTVVTHEDATETTVTLAAADGTVDVRVAVTNAGSDPVELGSLAPLADAATPFGPSDRVFEHGYQSWTPTATQRLDERFPAEPPENRPQMTDLAAPTDARTSHYLTALTGDAGHLTLGFLDHDSYLGRFDVRTDDGTRLSAVCPADGVALAPGETRESATLRIDATRPVEAALASLATAVGDRMDARVPEAAPTGWCSWYHYFTDVVADDVRANVDALDDWGVPVDVVQLDDGYEAAFGDWRTLDSGFGDLGQLCDDVADAGYTPGLWLAPFYVQADSALAADHPELLVTDGDGDPVDAGPRHGPMYGLDTTHPSAQAWLADTFETVVSEWGFSYLKLDFLYAAALPGQRHADCTRAEAYRTGLETIRDAVGDDVFVLGCGAPTFPSVGLVDAMRVGPDTAPWWRREDDPASEPAHENAVRNVLNRQFCHRRLWLTDPDCQLVRATTDLTDAERRAFATLVALTGGTNVVSDAIAEIDDAGRDLFERTLPPVDGGRVEGVGHREFPDRLVHERPADGAVAVAVFNWTDDPRRVRVDPDAVVDADRGRCLDAFAGTVHDGPVERNLGPHDVLLVHCAPARDRPHLLGARHLANAADQVTALEWEGDDATGTLAVTVDAPRPVTLAVATPGDWTLDGASDSATVGGGSAGRSTGSDSAGGTVDADSADETVDGATWVTVAPGTAELRFRREGQR